MNEVSARTDAALIHQKLDDRHFMGDQWSRMTDLLFARPAFFGRAVPGDIELRAIAASHAPRRRVFPATSFEALGFMLDANEDGSNAYFGVCTRLPHAQSGGAAGLQVCPALWADIDSRKLGVPESVVTAALLASSIPPTAIVLTGNGVHAYWGLVEPLDLCGDLGPPNREAVKAVLRDLSRVCHGDPAVIDLARVMRIPGSFNRKPETVRHYGKPFRTRIVASDHHNIYDFQALLEKVKAISEPLFSVSPRQPPHGTGGNIQLSPSSVRLGTKGPSDPNSPSGPSGCVGPNAGAHARIDPQARLQAMVWQGAGDSGIHVTQLQVTAALASRGEPAERIVSMVLQETRRAAGAHGGSWDWIKEERDIREMVVSAQRKFGSAPDGPMCTRQTPSEDAESLLIQTAALSAVEYDRQRDALAERLGIRRATLDREVRARRPTSEKSLAGQPIHLEVLEPWPQPVEGSALFASIVDSIGRFVVLSSPHEAALLATWIIHTYVYGLYPVTPRVAILSPEKRCGKSTLLGLLHHLASKAKLASSVTPAAMFRFIESCEPTLLLDEADTFNLKENHDLRALLNAGHLVTERVLRAVGDDHEVREFKVFCPLAIAAIGSLPGTVEDRSIVIRMRRRKEGETVESFPHLGSPELEELKRKIARWSDDNQSRLARKPVLPPSVRDRMADNFTPILSVAEALGESPALKIRAAIEWYASKSEDAEDEQLGPKLLADIRQVFLERGKGEFTSAELCSALLDIDGAPWSDFSGKQLSPNQMARLLRPYGIKPRPLWNQKNKRGYATGDFDEAFARYTPAIEEPLDR